jgi:hypothetical protein
MAAHAVWILYWRAAMLCHWLSYTINFKLYHRKKVSGERFRASGGHFIGLLGPNHHPERGKEKKKTHQTTGTKYS